jgi:AcrR family transcriptional regulator
MPRRTGEETKDLLIRTGISMLLDRGITAGVSHIRLQEVVRRAGLTTGAAYRLWADQDAFHHDLAVAAATWRAAMPIAEPWSNIAGLVESGAPLMAAVRVGSQAHVDTFDDADRRHQRSARSFLVALALRATSGSWSDLRDASVARHAESVREFAEMYRSVLALYRRRMRPPFTVEDFTVAMAALGEGFALQAIEGIPHPHLKRAGPPGVGEDWTLFGLSVWALTEGYTEPVTEDPGAVGQAATGVSGAAATGDRRTGEKPVTGEGPAG